MMPSTGAALARRLLAMGAALLLAACSSTRPWVNQPIHPQSVVPSASPVSATTQSGETPSIVAAITLSGGGARAAAFGLGVLRELKATRFEWQGRSTSILDEVGLVSGVSGGSVLASYYVAFGDDTFTRFEHDFLLANFQSSLIGQAFAPTTLYRMTSPWYGRSNVLEERLNRLYRGKTFGDLLARRSGPRLLVTATDLTTGAPFEFTPEQFALICSDLNSVPLSVAVSASSAVPILLSPVTLRNYAGSCEQSKQLTDATPDERNLQARLLNASMQSYLDAENRPFLHLVDGGLVDNLGVRGLLVRTVAGGALDASFANLPVGSVRKIILISVNSERDAAERIDRSDRVPGLGKVLDALVFGAGARATHETMAAVKDNAQRWAEELAAVRGSEGSPFAADAEIHVISVSLRDLKDEHIRHALLHVPTALTILPLQVRQLEEAGRAVLRGSPAFQRLRDSLARPGGTASAAAQPER
ncbi:patatin-like phospholipase family protein [Massilia niastensis]|uniref:patatin-like phospholipase family protein n=1 Tax=Massilia niastensis TaxID=544911 RepID=UPI0003607B5C|nr:patatin-like phospholipase family protein [Massilia niastensis]